MAKTRGGIRTEISLVLWDIAIDAVKQLLVLGLDCLSPNVALGGSAGKSATFDDNNMFRGSDLLVDIAATVELPRSPDDFLLELLGVHSALLRSLNEQGGRRAAVSNDNALENKFATGHADVVLDRPKLTDDERLWVMWSRIVRTYFVSHLRLLSLLIQSSLRPRERYFPISTSWKRSPVWKWPSAFLSETSGQSPESDKMTSSKSRPVELW